MTYSEAKLLAETLSSRVDLASHSYYECYVMEQEKAQELLESILMEYVEGSEKGVSQEL